LKTAGGNLLKMTTNNVNVRGVKLIGQQTGAAGVGSLLYYYICDGGRVSDCHFSAHSGKPQSIRPVEKILT